MRIPFVKKIAALSFALLCFCAADVSHLSSVNLTPNTVFPRVITPNGDRINDLVYFCYENPTELPVKGTIYDAKSMKVAAVKRRQDIEPLFQTILVWDGKDDSGSVVSSGVYIYKIEIGSQQHTGTVAVAR